MYERRGDLSPDGSLFVYFARGAPRGAAPHEVADSWVTISRPPYFTALALWFVGGTYHTGAFFPNRSALWNGFAADPPDVGHLPDWLTLTSSPPPYIDRTNDWTERTVLFNRLLRDGWERVADTPAEVWQHRNLSQDLTLIMTQTYLGSGTYVGRYASEYSVRSERNAEVIALGRADWADWDQHARLMIAWGGQLLHWQGRDTLRPVADFNPHVPQPRPAPAWASSWPRL